MEYRDIAEDNRSNEKCKSDRPRKYLHVRRDLDEIYLISRIDKYREAIAKRFRNAANIETTIGVRKVQTRVRNIMIFRNLYNALIKTVIILLAVWW